MLSDILDEASTLLSTVAGATIATTEKELATHHHPPRFVWVPLGATGEGVARNKTIGAPSTRELQLDAWAVECHCWGTSLRVAEQLRRAALTAMRRAVRGRRYVVRDTRTGDQAWMQHGFVLIVTFEIWESALEVHLPTLEDASSLTAPVHSVAVQTAPAPDLLVFKG
ncbi:hypothetical protein LZC95_50175 [Pendulispora brunnea]|uniref:DUF3168 domain-containing protein n=1 Tax=Pendulispora brunnea TaxID=2905690 RepID=A0ABZ2K7B2_9BACT